MRPCRVSLLSLPQPIAGNRDNLAPASVSPRSWLAMTGGRLAGNSRTGLPSPRSRRAMFDAVQRRQGEFRPSTNCLTMSS